MAPKSGVLQHQTFVYMWVRFDATVQPVKGTEKIAEFFFGWASPSDLVFTGLINLNFIKNKLKHD